MNRTIQIGLVLAAAVPMLLRAESATLAAPANSAAWMLSEAAAGSHGGSSSSAGYLGVDLRDISQDELGTLKLKDARGAEIVLVDHDAPAGKAGLREHDVVLQMNGQAISTKEQISRMLRDCAPGRLVTLLISRDGRQMTVTAQMSTHEEVDRDAWEHHVVAPDLDLGDPSDEGPGEPSQAAPPVRAGNSFIGSVLRSSSYNGAILEKMPPQLADYFGVAGGRGLLVMSVKPNSPEALAGMHAGDVVVRANDKPVASTGDWSKAVKNTKGKPFRVVVLRDKKEQTLTLMPDSRKHSALEFPVLQIEQAPAAIARLGLSWLPGS
ncbi:MAG TPA: PDZ domain-containing protein [Acidobacteriaceae bacterium]|nr:PDZ domain-containing protein [Acidobacteriaceae bacterium]